MPSRGRQLAVTASTDIDSLRDQPWPDEERPTALRARLLNRAQLAALPKPEPLIERTIDRNTVAVLAGHYGTGKSFTALDWSACVATGKPWQTRRVHRGRALYIAAEGAYGLDARLAAWEEAWRRRIPDDALHVLPEPPNLLNSINVLELANLVEAGRYRLVTLDTISRCMPGADENSAKDMSRVVDALDKLRRSTDGGAVIGVHHTGKDGSTIRGSSALEAGVDTAYLAEGDARLIKLQRIKRKDGPTDDMLTLRLETVGASCIVMSATAADTSRGEDALLSVFMSTFDETGATKADLRNTADLPPATFHRALNGLLAKGILTNEGSDKRPHYRRNQDA